MAKSVMGWRDTIAWIAENDDTEWVEGDPDAGAGSPSVTAALAADIFGKTTEDVRLAIRRYFEKRSES
jgi:hypothetical protein